MKEVAGVNSVNFSEVLQAAVAEEPCAVEAILSRFMPLFLSRSMIDSKFDEDLRQYIIMRAIMLIPKFKRR
jgi:hypothetical protein